VRLATIEGQVKYEIDTNGDGDTSDTDEKGTLEGWTVYLDADRDGQLDAGEVSTVTGVGGAYSFVGLAGGLYRANVIVPTTRGWVAVTPSSASRDVSVPAGQTVTAADFLVSYPYNPAKPNLVEDNNGFRKFTPALVYSPQGELSIFWDITNTGTIAASVFAVDFYVSADSVISPTDFFLGRVRISQTLAPGNYVDVNLQLTGVGGLPAIPAGEYYVGVIIDAANEIIESNEIDNMGVIKEGDTNFSQLEVRSRPDLQDRGDQWSTFPAGVTPGQMWNLQWDVLNAAMPDPTGAGQSNASNGFRVAFVASRDQTITVFDDLLGVVSVSSLDAGDWADVDLSLLAFPNILAGDYYVGAIIDPYSEVAEADETNNIAISLDTVLTVLPTGTMSEGTVYLDANGNEQIDEGEAGLPGWRLRAYSDDNNNGQHDADEAIYTMQTDGLGRYPLAVLPAGTYLIELANPDTSMWRQVAPVDSSFIPTPQEVTITADKEVVGDINFGVVQFSKVGGTVWHDFNGDGTFNDGVLFNEDGLVSGLEWDVRFFRDLNDNGKLDTALGEVRQTTMSNNGAFTFSAVVPGNYVIEEVIQSGYLATTTANGVTGTTITSAELSDGVFFGNALPVTISGQKWYDLDADGIRDVGEPGLAGWTIYIDSNANGLFDPGEPSTVTDGADGGYIFNNLRPGRYITREVLQQGWIQSHPGTEYQYDQILTSGHTYIGVFGNYQYAEIRGLVFHDLDADGNQRPEEPGLGGWTVEAFRDDNLNGLRDDPNEVLIEVLTGYDIPATTDVN
ncbi:MAG: hypothetical protein HQ546_07005, partial [Planctomycetes bacterium]|nr:hypothetical protein [Planctomycetota bacterium]